MKNKAKFFKSTILLQFIPVTLLGIFLYSKFKRQEILNIPELHPHELNIGALFPVVFFLACGLISIPYLFSKKTESDEEADSQKILRTNNFWKFAFYSNVVLLLLVSIFLTIANLRHPKEFIIIGDEFYYVLVFLQALSIPVLSLILASFMLSSGVLWKTNKTLATVILFFGFLLFGAWIWMDLLCINEFRRISENHYLENEIPVETSDDVVEVEPEDYEYQGDVSEDRGESVQLEEAWNYFLNHKYDLSGKQEFTEVRFPIYSNFLLNTEDDGDYFLTGYVNEIRRDPKMISLAFEMYQSILYNSVSRRTYRIANFDKVIDGLLFTYEDLHSEENEGNLQKIYRIMSAEKEGYGLDAGEYYPELEKYFSTETIELLEATRLSNGSQFSNGDIVWFYSFWARRHHENNSDEVVSVLREIKENYN